MGAIKQSLAWWCYARGAMTPEKLVRAAAEIGYAAVDLADPAYWSLIKEYGLEIAVIEGHRSIEEGFNRRENHDRIEREIVDHLELATKWGIPNLIVFSGNRAGQTDAVGAEITAEGLRRVARSAEDAGVNLVLELLNSKVDHPDYQCDQTAWGIEVCKMVQSQRVKLLYDIYHMQIMEGDIIRTIQTHHAYFGHYHTAGNPGRHELDGTQELNYAPIVKAIRDTGYTGYICHEFIPTGDPIKALRTAFELCDPGGGNEF
jgi:hydroxypyruvate isomerase